MSKRQGSLLGWKFTIAQVFKSSAEEGYFPAFFKKVTSKDAPIVGMVTITALQTLLSLMTISPSLNKQFNVLVDLAAVSYTHLDVYKRQIRGIVLRFINFCGINLSYLGY